MRLGRWSEVRQLTGLMDRERQARLWIEGALSLLLLLGLSPRTHPQTPCLQVQPCYRCSLLYVGGR